MSEITKYNCNDMDTNKFSFKFIAFWDVTSHILVNRCTFWRNLMPPTLSSIKEAAGSSKCWYSLPYESQVSIKLYLNSMESSELQGLVLMGNAINFS
jgi:hypothetical protein